jgi:hypothetical protein
MAAFSATIRSCGTRLGRSMLAALISLSLVTSLMHCCCCLDGDETTVTFSVAQTSFDDSGKTSSCSPGVHCCHCLAHITTLTSQTNIASVEYVTRLDRAPSAPAPDSADLASPFRPPRA